jgi:starch phosphorylase
MVKHTLKSLGPKVLAQRMLRDYVDLLYRPAAASSRALLDGTDGAEELATWKRQVRAEWPSVRIDHVESFGLSDNPEIGATLGIRVFASLGALSPADVQVEVVHGRVLGDNDELSNAEAGVLGCAESYEGGRHRFEGEVSLARTGPIGYTVRVLPHHRLLSSPAELGLVAWPAEAAVG